MKLLSELVEYANNCINDKRISVYEDYISCQAHKWACQRFLDDIELSERSDCSFYWDEHEAGLIVDWFRLLRHSKGVFAGKPIELTKWQKFLLCQVYGWRRKADKTRRFRKAFFEVGRKNAKSQMEAGVALDEISPGGRYLLRPPPKKAPDSAPRGGAPAPPSPMGNFS